MESAFWERVVAEGHRVPDDRPLADLTTELTTMLGDPDPGRRDGIAYGLLAAWVSAGVYDDLLQGLGDGMAAGLQVGLGEDGTDTVFRRSFSALVLAGCLARDNERRRLPADTVLRWGDRVAGWLVRERDLRGYVPGKGWAHAVAHGADALAALAGSAAVGRLELTVVLDVVADRVLAPTSYPFVQGEDDRLAHAAMSALRRDLVGLEVVEPWVARLAAGAGVGTGPHVGPDLGAPAAPDEAEPSATRRNAAAFLRALHLQLSLAPRPPAVRPDLLLVLIEHLRRVHPALLG